MRRTSIVIATVAALALAGTAGAATHYLITSTKQIKPSVLSQLRGQRGPRGNPGATGAQGPAGPSGATGAAGPQGPAGPQGAAGPSNETDVPTDQGFVVDVGTGTASVNDDGSVASSNTGVTGVTHPATGLYCVAVASGIDPASAVATPREDDSTDAVEVDVLPTADDCPTGNAEVVTFQMTFGNAASAAHLSGLRK